MEAEHLLVIELNPFIRCNLHTTKGFMWNIKNQVVMVIRIIYIHPSNHIFIEVINIAAEKRKSCPSSQDFRNVCKNLNIRTEINLLCCTLRLNKKQMPSAMVTNKTENTIHPIMLTSYTPRKREIKELYMTPANNQMIDAIKIMTAAHP